MDKLESKHGIQKIRIALLLGPAIVAAIGLMLYGPIPQDPSYHLFCDVRRIWGIPNFGDVVTNFPFVIIGIIGLRVCHNHRGAFRRDLEHWPFNVFFIGLILLGFGSTWYHLNPDNKTLFWDRVPIAFVAMGLFAATINERLRVGLGSKLLPWLLLGAAASCLYWLYTEQAGRGDLRFYVLAQYYPLIALPVLLLFFKPAYTHGGWYWGLIFAYAGAKGFEHTDCWVYETFSVISGHNLKHCCAAGATYCMVEMLRRRQPIDPE